MRLTKQQEKRLIQAAQEGMRNAFTRANYENCDFGGEF